MKKREKRKLCVVVVDAGEQKKLSHKVEPVHKFMHLGGVKGGAFVGEEIFSLLFAI